MGATVRLILCITKSIHHTGEIITHDSGFCVGKGIIELHKHRVYGQTLIKKQGSYWPHSVLGDLIDGYFGNKDIGTVMTYKQVIERIDFFINCQKDDCYVTKIMSTHGTVNEVQGHAMFWMVRGEQIPCNYAEPHSGHNKANHQVDDHNNGGHDPIEIAEMWMTKWWPN